MKKEIFQKLCPVIALSAAALGLPQKAQGANIAIDGAGIIGVNDAMDGDAGTPRANAGSAANIRDGDLSTRVDNWFGGNTDIYSYIGVVWPTLRYDEINTITLTLATFGDGGWFGVSGVGPGAGNALFGADLIEPSVQITTDGGVTWTDLPFGTATSDYYTVMDGHVIGGGGTPATAATITFDLIEPISGINGIRFIGENGGSAGPDANGFVGVFELEVEAEAPADSDSDGMPDPWESAHGLVVGTNDAEGDADSDGVSNIAEYNAGTAPDDNDSDDDGLTDGDEINTHSTSPTSADTDGDGLEDGAEVNTHNTNPLLADTDGDGLSDGNEVNTHGSNPRVRDSDADSYPDGLEVAQGTSPTDPASYPDNIALLGTGITGVNDAIDSDEGIPYEHAGVAANINDGNPATRLDTWRPEDTTMNSYAGILWDQPTMLQVEGLSITLATFGDGGWFGLSGWNPGAGTALIAADLIEPTIQITTDGGVTWTTVAHTSDYLTVMEGHGIGGGGNPNPTSATSEFTLNEPVSGITGIRIIGENGGLAGPDATGFLGVFELEVSASLAGDSDSDGMADEWEALHGLNVGTNDAGADPDEDGLSNLQEFVGGTDPQNADTDGDGLEDGAERTLHETDPTLADTDGDGLSDSEEINTTETDPLLADTDGDGLSDGDEVNTHGTDPLIADTDSDQFPDGVEVALGTDPAAASSFPSNASRIGTGIIGVNDAVDSDAGTAHWNAGSPANIVDGNTSTRVDTFNGAGSTTASFVGVQWDEPLPAPVERLELTHAIFFDGGWFGPNGTGSGAGSVLASTDISEPTVQVSQDGGVTWTTVTHTSDYLTALEGHPLPAVAFGAPTSVTATFTLDEPQSDIDAIRIIGTEGGTAVAGPESLGGFIGVFELAVHIHSEGGGNGTPIEFTGLVKGTGDLEITWSSAPGESYDIQESTDLENWANLASDIPSGGANTTYTVSTSGTFRFFRIVRR